MNKKVQKGLVAAVAATMGASVVAPTAFAASQTQNVSLAAEYEAAYNATAKALESKTQKDLTAARVLVDGLYNRVKGTADEKLATTLSTLLDPAQQVKLVAFFDAMDKAKASEKQADINAAQELIIDMPQVWRNSYSTAMDEIQQKLIDKVVVATEKAKTSVSEDDKVAAQALLDEVKKVTNNAGVEAWAKAYQATINAIETTPKVTSVSATNLKEVQITFNKDVDVDNATFTVTDVKSGASKFTQSTTNVTQIDGKTVVLTTDSNLINGDFYNVSLKDVVVDGSKEPINPFTTSVKANDTSAPAVSSVKAVTTSTTTRSISVTFTEPVSFGLVKIGSDIATAANSGDSKTWTFTLASSSAADLEVGKSYDLSIAGLSDLANNYAANPLTYSVTIARDEVKPTYTLSALNPKQFDIVFDKTMSSAVAVDAITVKDANGNVIPQANLAVRQSDKKTFRVTLATSPIASDKTSADVSVTVKSLVDSVGNSVATKTSTVTLAKETVKPEFTAVRVLPGTNNKIEVTFSEKVTDVDSADFVLTDSSGSVVPVNAVTDATSDSANKVVFTTTSALANDTYNLALKVDTVVDSSSNTNAAKALKFSYNGAVATQVIATILDDKNVDSTADLASDSQVVAVKFNTADVVNGISNATGDYKAGAADNAANYTINGAALPAGTVVTFNDNETTGKAFDYVTIDFTGVAAANKATALKQGGTIVLTAANVKTAAGSTIAYTSNTLTVVDKTAPTISSAFITGNATSGYKLTVVFSEAIKTAVLDDFILTGKKADTTTDAIAVLSNATVQSDATKVTFDVDVVTAGAIVANGFKLTTDIAANIDTIDNANIDLTANTTGVTVTNYAN